MAESRTEQPPRRRRTCPRGAEFRGEPAGRRSGAHPAARAGRYYGALGGLAALEIIDWPVALAIAAGHALVQNQHNRVAEEIGEALEDA